MLFNKSMADRRKAKEDSKRLSKELENEKRRVEYNQSTMKDLQDRIVESKKKIVDKEKENAVTKKRIRELDEDYDSASKRMNLLSFEYFHVAKKEKAERQKGKISKCLTQSCFTRR